MAKQKDEFSQLGYIGVTESGANTLTFAGLTVFSGLGSGSAMVISKIEYNIPIASVGLMVATGDGINFGLAGDDGLASVDLDDAQVYDWNSIRRFDFGTAGSAQLDYAPVIKDFSELPGGGRLVPADRLYIWVQGVSLASAVTLTARFHFTVMDLAPAQYLELVQSLRVLT